MNTRNASKAMLQPRLPGTPEMINLLSAPKRVRAFLGDILVADSRSVLTLRANHFLPTYYFPAEDVDAACLQPSTEQVEQPALGAAQTVWDVVAGSERQLGAAWSYTIPATEPLHGLSGRIGLEFKRFSRWMEEGEDVFVHPRDPYARIDVLDCDRLIEVVMGGYRVARTEHARLLIETNLPVRYYLPVEDIDMARLSPSRLRTRCPYKGEANYWNVMIGDVLVENVAWSYVSPSPEVSRIGGMICFYNEKIEATLRDGIALSPFGL